MKYLHHGLLKKLLGDNQFIEMRLIFNNKYFLMLALQYMQYEYRFLKI